MITLRELLVAPHPNDEHLKELRATQRRHGDAVNYLTAEKHRLEQGIEWRKRKNKAHLIAKWESELEGVMAALEASQAALTTAQINVEEVDTGWRRTRDEAIDATYADLTERLIEDMGARQAADLVITHRPGYSSFEVGLWDSDLRNYWHGEACTVGQPLRFIAKIGDREKDLLDTVCPGCEPVSAKVVRFGYEAAVYGPETEYHFNSGADLTRSVKDPLVNWGTIGSQSVDNAKASIKVHTWAVAIAERLREQLDLPLPPAAQAILDSEVKEQA